MRERRRLSTLIPLPGVRLFRIKISPFSPVSGRVRKKRTGGNGIGDDLDVRL